MGSWNLSQICKFCCFKTIVLVFILKNRGWGCHTIGHFLWMSNLLGLVWKISCCKKNFVIACYDRYVSHMTSSCIFQNLIWNKTLTAAFVANCSKYFRCPKLYWKLIGYELLLFSYLLKNQSLKFTFSTDPLFQVFLWWSSQQEGLN